MITLLKNWPGRLSIDGTEYVNAATALSMHIVANDTIHIKLYPKVKQQQTQRDTLTQYRITVKKYMTQKATPEFDFMAKWNNDNPMPLRTMVGTIEKETRGMVYMKLHGLGEPTVSCMRCGRVLTNPVSKMYGIGPECITHVPILADMNIEDVAGIKKKLVDVTWEGWIIKSAITNQEEV